MSESKTKQKTDNPEPVKLPSFQEAMIYDYVYTIDQLLLLGLSPRVHKLVKGRFERMKANGIRVPEDYENLNDAVKLVNTGFIDTKLFYGDGTKGSSRRLVGNFSKIVVGKGEHQIDGDYIRHLKIIKYGAKNRAKNREPKNNFTRKCQRSTSAGRLQDVEGGGGEGARERHSYNNHCGERGTRDRRLLFGDSFRHENCG
jgi:hypothetical protein